MRFFTITVFAYHTEIKEKENTGIRHWTCVIDGETIHYRIEKGVKSQIHNWFERGTIEAQYHAQNLTRTGMVLWQRRPKTTANTSAKKKAIQAKMEKLL